MQQCQTRTKKKRRLYVTALGAVFSGSVSIAGHAGQDSNGGVLGEIYGYETRAVQIATGYAKAPEDAPSVTTVLTAADIEAMGVRTLRMALESVAGFQWQPSLSGFEIVSLRGLNSSFEGRTLILIDGLPIAQGFGAIHSHRIYEAYPVENIERIEVIRGPGSVLYGADAFAGVINVITKSATRIRDGQFGARAGSFNTYEAWLRKSGQWGPLTVSANLSGGSTAGQDSIVEQDLQTQLDQVFGTHASLAPGPVSMGYDRANADFDFSLGPWKLKLAYFGLQNSGVGVGRNALDPIGRSASHVAFGNLEYRQKLTPVLEVSGRFAYTDTATAADVRSFPPGAFGGLFRNGVLEGLTVRGSQLRAEATAYWSGIKDHVLTVGGGYYTRDLYEFKQSANTLNFDVLPLRIPGQVPVPTPGEQLVDFSADQLSIAPKVYRNVGFGLVQDEWQLARDWTLTTGVRVDSYSDYGVTTNPRAALVWSAGSHTSYRLGYGRAFRSPGYYESSGRNNGRFGFGDPNLKPETLDSFELGTSLWGPHHRVNATLFGIATHDRISSLPDNKGVYRFFNHPQDELGYGMEMESTWRPNDRWRFRLNYTWQHPTGRESSSIGTAPAHAVYAEAQWSFTQNWYTDLNLRALLDRKRQAADPRPAIADYAVVNLSLRRKRLFGFLDLGLSVRNLFDADLREPSLTSAGYNTDFPLEGINAFGEVSMSF